MSFKKVLALAPHTDGAEVYYIAFSTAGESVLEGFQRITKKN